MAVTEESHLSRTDILASTDRAEKNLTSESIVLVEVDEDVTAFSLVGDDVRRKDKRCGP